MKYFFNSTILAIVLSFAPAAFSETGKAHSKSRSVSQIGKNIYQKGVVFCQQTKPTTATTCKLRFLAFDSMTLYDLEDELALQSLTLGNQRALILRLVAQKTKHNVFTRDTLQVKSFMVLKTTSRPLMIKRDKQISRQVNRRVEAI